MPKVDVTINLKVELSFKLLGSAAKNSQANSPLMLFPAQLCDVDDEGLLLKLCQMVEPVWSVVWRGVLPST